MGGNDGTVIGGGKRTKMALQTVVYAGKSVNVKLWWVWAASLLVVWLLGKFA